MKNRGAAGSSTLLAVGAIILTVGFLFWLYQRSSSLEERVEPVLEDAEGAAGGPAFGLEQLRADPEAAIGSRAALEGVEVDARLGRGVFAVRLDESTLLPVLLDRDLIERGTQLYGGDRVDVWGRVYTLNDSIRTAWIEAGAVEEGREASIPASASFLLADSLVIE